MRNLVTFILVTFIVVRVCGQTVSATDAAHIEKVETGKFDRRSVTVIPVAVGGASQYYSEIVKGVESISQNPRFDKNAISAADMKEFQSQFSGLGINLEKGGDPEATNKIIELIKSSKLLEAVINSSSNLDSIAARVARSQKRVVTTALGQSKIKLPTVGEMMVMMNGTFIGISVLDKVEVGKDDATATGGFYWFRLDVSKVENWNGSKPSLSEVEISFVKFSSGKASASPTKVGKDGIASGLVSFLSEELPEEASLGLDVKAARLFGRKIVKMAYGMDEFRLRGTIQDTESDYRIDLGKREGVYLDQGFKVFEQTENDDKKIVSVYKGFGRVGTVADNTEKIDALSSMYRIIGSYEQGHIVVSHDQGFDVVVRPNLRLVSIPKEFGELGELLYLPDLLTEKATSSFNVDITGLYNIAELTKVKQLFVGVSVGVGLPMVTPNTKYTAVTYTYEGNVVVQKKFWLSRLAASVELQAGISSLAVSGTSGAINYTFATGMQYAAGLSAGLEYAASPDLSIGAELGYRYVLKPTTVKYTINDAEYEAPLVGSKKTIADNIDLGGIRFGLKVSYSLPPLF